jgi:hypothetical protein
MLDKQPTAVQVKKLPWPSALFGQGVLTAREAHDVGRLIVERIWQGQFDRGHHRKQWSVRQLHKVLGAASPARFTRCVQVYEVVSELKLGAQLDGVSISTLFMIAGLKKGARKKVAQQALKEQWSKGRLEQEIAKEVGPRRSGRPQGPAFLRALSQCSHEALLKDVDKLHSLDAPALRMAIKQADRLIRDLQKLQSVLGKHSPGKISPSKIS